MWYTTFELYFRTSGTLLEAVVPTKLFVYFRVSRYPLLTDNQSSRVFSPTIGQCGIFTAILYSILSK